MSEVITRPKAGKTQAAKAVPAAQQARDESVALVHQVATIVQTLVMSVTFDGADIPRQLHNIHFGEAEHLLGRLLAPECHEQDSSDPAEDDIHDHLALISSELEAAFEVMDTRPIPGMPVAVHTMLAATTLHASNLADRLWAAYRDLPRTMDDLRALTTYAGAKPFRDRPQPPIRRVEQPDTQEFKIHGNNPGALLLNSPDELHEFVRHRADLIASLSVWLQQGIPHVDESFQDDYIDHLNDLIYQQQAATHLLLGMRSAA